MEGYSCGVEEPSCNSREGGCGNRPVHGLANPIQRSGAGREGHARVTPRAVSGEFPIWTGTYRGA